MKNIWNELKNKNHKRYLGGLDIFKYIGPGLLVTVGFIDPGNWASNFAAGSEFGYALLQYAVDTLAKPCSRIVTRDYVCQFCTDRLFFPVTNDRCRLRTQIHQRANRITGPAFGSGLQKLAQSNEREDHGGRLKIQILTVLGYNIPLTPPHGPSHAKQHG